MANLYDLLSNGFPADRDKPAFLLGDGSAVSYGELEAGAARVAGHLIAEGVAVARAVAVHGGAVKIVPWRWPGATVTWLETSVQALKSLVS